MCDFNEEYDGENEDYGDNGFSDDDFEDSEISYDGDPIPGSNDGYWDGLEWQDWMIIGPLSEEIASEKRERDRIRRENEEDDDC